MEHAKHRRMKQEAPWGLGGGGGYRTGVLLGLFLCAHEHCRWRFGGRPDADIPETHNRREWDPEGHP